MFGWAKTWMVFFWMISTCNHSRLQVLYWVFWSITWNVLKVMMRSHTCYRAYAGWCKWGLIIIVFNFFFHDWLFTVPWILDKRTRTKYVMYHFTAFKWLVLTNVCAIAVNVSTTWLVIRMHSVSLPAAYLFHMTALFGLRQYFAARIFCIVCWFA